MSTQDEKSRGIVVGVHRRMGRAGALLALVLGATFGHSDVLPVGVLPIRGASAGAEPLPSLADLVEKREALAASLPPAAAEAEAYGIDLCDLYERGWRLYLDALPGLSSAHGWRRDRLAWEIGTAYPAWVRGRLSTAARRGGGAVAWPSSDPIREWRDAVHEANDQLRRLQDAGEALELRPLPERLPGGPGVPSPTELRALLDLLGAETDARREHRAWAPDTQGDDEKVAAAIRAKFQAALAQDGRLAEARWGLADAAQAKSWPSAAGDRAEAARATKAAVAEIRAARLPLAEERARALEARPHE